MSTITLQAHKIPFVEVIRAMAWAKPQHSRKDVDWAGDVLIQKSPDLEEFERALEIINNWRSSHAYPLNTFQATLRYKSKRACKNSLVAQRIKRLSSIHLKLHRFDWLKLSEMQDIGGCRAIVENTKQVRDLVDLYKKSGLKHKLDKEDDYISRPKHSGYRGVHLIYRYKSDKIDTYNGLKVEIQFRSAQQHAWATAVETVGTFTKQALKSSQGEQDWLRFFALMGTFIAMGENCPAVPDTPKSMKELKSETRDYEDKLDVLNRLDGYRTALQVAAEPVLKTAHFFLIELDIKAKRVTVVGYNRDELNTASDEYLKVERRLSDPDDGDAVLVSADTVAAVKRAYPNYFLDTRVFMRFVRQAIKV
jgi:ppGpp synthetase/RelA/SpoT-type nucleotidyltranferase